LFLLLGSSEDLLCRDVYRGLLERGFKARIVKDVFGSSARSEWELATVRSSFHLELRGDTKLSGSDIEGVLVARILTDSQPQSGTRNRSHSVEEGAASLGWLWSLSCPVINRYRPEFWFDRPELIDDWKGRLEPFGLAAAGPAGASKSYVTTSAGHLAAVVGSRVIWDEGAPEQLHRVSGALAQFTLSLGLEYVEFRLEDSPEKPRVQSVELFPTYQEFCPSSRHKIVSELVNLLTTSQSQASPRTVTDSWF
jgi:hypothetical protein